MKEGNEDMQRAQWGTSSQNWSRSSSSDSCLLSHILTLVEKNSSYDQRMHLLLISSYEGESAHCCSTCSMCPLGTYFYIITYVTAEIYGHQEGVEKRPWG